MLHPPAQARALARLAALGVSAAVAAGALTGGPARARAAPAEDGGRAALVRLDLALGAAWRDDSAVTGASDLRATGGALSDVAVRGGWWRSGAGLGLTAHGQVARFALAGGQGVLAADQVTVTGFDAGAALAWRWGAGDRLGLEARAGYGLHRIPVAALAVGPAGDAALVGGALHAHGVDLGGDLRLAVGSRLGLELAVEGTPLMFGASHAGASLRPWRLAGRGQAALTLLARGRSRFSALLAYELVRVGAQASDSDSDGDGVGAPVELRQSRQQVALGLRASWGPAPVPHLPTPLPTPTVAVRPMAPAVAARPQPSAISGLVRAGSGNGQPVAARIRIVELGLETVADPAGAFRLEVPPGRYTLSISADGFVSQTKQLDTRPGEQRIYNVDLARPLP